MAVPGKYLKDENNQIFSPITSIDSIYNNDNIPLNDCILKYNILWSGKQSIPSTNSGNSVTITMTKDPRLFDFILIIRNNKESFIEYSKNVTRHEGWVTSTSDYGLEKLNMFGMILEYSSGLQWKLRGNVYAGINTNGSTIMDLNYSSVPLTMILGIKL